MRHTRSDDSVGATDSHSPFVHWVNGTHMAPLSVPDHVPYPLALDAWHASQTRLDVVLPAVFWPWPAGQVRQVMQSNSEPDPAAEKLPVAQAVQEALPAADQYPAPHSEHMPEPAAANQPALHIFMTSLPSQACPAGQSAQARSSQREGARVSTWIDVHVCTGAHMLPSAMLEKVTPLTQASHVRSCVAVPSPSFPAPAGHTRHAVHRSAPATAK